MRVREFVVIGVYLLGLSTHALAVPSQISIQGRLTDAGGVPVSPGPTSIGFRIYDAQFLGTQLWPPGMGFESQTIDIGTGGLWSGSIGKDIPLNDSVFADSVRWLEISVGMTILPRTRLVTGPYAYRVATVDGATGGTITGKVSIGPGHVNTGADCFVAGNANQVINDYATVGGGHLNSSTGGAATVAGGQQNSATAFASTVAGGAGNYATGIYSTAGGGFFNNSDADWAVVSGGNMNRASGLSASVGGGGYNKARGSHSTVGGGGGINPGDSNSAIGDYSTIGGGSENLASGWSSTVGGGVSNSAGSHYATVPGGFENVASGSFSLAAGCRAQAIHNSSFVWSSGDINSSVFGSSADNQFLVRAPAGVGIGTNTPTTATSGQVLHVHNPDGPSALRLGDGSADGNQWEMQSTVIGSVGTLNISNITALTNPLQITGDGDVNVLGNICAVNFACPSDGRLKEGIHTLENALECVESLRGVRYNWNDSTNAGRRLFNQEQIGLVAQEVQDVVPQAVHELSDGYLAVDYARLVPLLIEGMKEQQRQIEELRAELRQSRK